PARPSVASLLLSHLSAASACDLAASERIDVVSAERLAADAPLAACDLLDHAPDRATHVLALDLDQRVCESPDDLSLLRCREDALDELYLNECHESSLSDGLVPTMVGEPGGAHIGRFP